MNRVGRGLGVALAGVLIGAPAMVALRAQSPATDQKPTFRSTTALVLVDVTVLDRDGRPVAGLGADDFHVRLDGQDRPVRAVTFESVPTTAPAAPSSAATHASATPHHEVTNAIAGSGPRVFVVLVDDLSIPPSRGKSLFRAAGRFVASLPATDAVGLATSSHFTTINPTFDHGAIAMALDHAVGDMIDPSQEPGPAMTLSEAIGIYASDTQMLNIVVARDCFGGRTPTQAQLSQSDCAEQVAQKGRAVGGLVQNTSGRQLQAYLDVINAMRDAPGLKHLVILSDGLALSTHPDTSVLLEPLAKAAASAGVQMSILSATADGSDVSQQSPMSGVDKLTDDRALRANIQTIAEMTGGTYYSVIGLADATLARVALASSAIYQLGVEAPESGGAGRDYALAVKVARPDLTVRANRHAMGPIATPPVPVATQLRLAIGNGAPLYGVPFNVGEAITGAEAAGQLNVNANVVVPGSARGPLTLLFAIGSRSGVVRSGRTTLAATGPLGDYRAALAVPVPPGEYRLRFAVADADGKVGSLQTNVTAQLNHVGPLLASDLLTGWSSGDRQAQFLALERVPATATTLLSSLEVYGAGGSAPPAGTTVHLSLLTNDEIAVADGDAALSVVHGALHADGALALSRIPAGTYTLRAAVLAAGKLLGTVTASVRLSGSGSSF